jgi:type IV pilus assembly protein PilC
VPPQYAYQGVDKTGKKVSGTLEATEEGQIRMQLRQMGIRPNRLALAGAMNTDLGTLFSGGGGAKTRLSLAQQLAFTRQLGVLISSGIPIVQGLDILSEQALERGPRLVFTGLRDKVSGGSFLWESMSAYPNAFPKMYIALIRAGEASGSIDQMLARLGSYLENTEKLRRLVKGAMMYPTIVTCIGVGVIGLMMVFVIPKFEEILSNNNQELPLPTQIVVNMSHFIIGNLWYLLGGIITTVFLLLRFLRTPEGKATLDRILFRMPLFGSLMQRQGVARFSRTMGTLLVSGVNLIDAIDICQATINNAVLEDAVGKIRVEIEAGRTLGYVLTQIKVFPRMAVQMISVGEATGSLDSMLEKVAQFYEEEVEMAVNSMSKLMEPIVLVFLGGTVGGMMIAMYLPIFKVAGTSG